MFESNGERIGLAIAVLIVAVMGVITFTGPYHKINKVEAQKSPFPPVHVSILINTTTIGKYSPAKITARVGQQVIFTNSSNADHTVTARTAAFDSKNIPVGGQWTYTPKKAGTFPFYCIYHPYMHGTLVVQP